MTPSRNPVETQSKPSRNPIETQSKTNRIETADTLSCINVTIMMNYETLTTWILGFSLGFITYNVYNTCIDKQEYLSPPNEDPVAIFMMCIVFMMSLVAILGIYRSTRDHCKRWYWVNDKFHWSDVTKNCGNKRSINVNKYGMDALKKFKNGECIVKVDGNWNDKTIVCQDARKNAKIT